MIPARRQEKAAEVLSPRPVLAAARCVHATIETASCRACETVCPRGAWRLEDEALHFEADRCDGCALCRPVCAPGAIRIERTPARGEAAGSRTLLAACDQAVATPGAGRVGCLHGLGLRELLRQYRAGWRIWLLARGDCDRCSRQPRQGGENLYTRIAQLNIALAQRERPPILVREIAAATWLALLPPIDARLATRRGFFAALAPRVPAPQRQQEETAPPGRQLDVHPHAIQPWSPRLLEKRCIACHACARVCPEAAITLEASLPAYRLDPRSCTGCGLCRDVCPRDAVELFAWSPPGPELFPLTRRNCPACGVAFHLPAGRDVEKCWICADKRTGGRLYQVMA